jgi:hypothetical protein
MPPIILSPINMNVSIDHRVEHRHGDDVVRMERLGETVIHKDEQDRKWGARDGPVSRRLDDGLGWNAIGPSRPPGSVR